MDCRVYLASSIQMMFELGHDGHWADAAGVKSEKEATDGGEYRAPYVVWNVPRWYAEKWYVEEGYLPR